MSDPGALRAAARLAEGPRGSTGPPAAAEPAAVPAAFEEVLGILAANKVPLLALVREWEGSRDPLWDRFSSRPETLRALEREKAIHGSLLGAYRAVAEAFRREQIAPVLFKSPGWFPYLSSNTDVLVAPAVFGRAATILESLGHIRFPHYREDHKLLFRTFDGGEPALSVHLHEAVSWGKVRILGGEEVAARAVEAPVDGVLVASPGDALAATLAHTILETDQVRLGDLRIARWCLDRGAGARPVLEEAERGRWKASAASALALYDAVRRSVDGRPLLGPEDADLVRRALEESPWAGRLLARLLPGSRVDLPWRLPRWYTKWHLVAIVAGDDRRDGETRLRDLAGSVWSLASNRLGVRCRPARLITVSGPDGAGKSRLAESLASTLALCEVPSRRLWSRGGFSAVAAAGKAIARRAAPSAFPGVEDERAKVGFLRSGWRRQAWAWLVALEQAASLQRLRASLALGRSVVCDRYAYDSLADLLARFPGGAALPRRAAAFLLAAAPPPDLAFLIDVEPEVAHSRKDDGTSIEARRRLGEAYRVIGAMGPFVRLDGRRPFPEMAQAAVETTLRRCFAAFERGGA